MSKFNTIIFDLDGVIIDSIHVIRLAFEVAYNEVVGIGIPPFEEYKKYFGRSLPKILNIMKLPQEMCAPFIRESYRLADKTEVFKGIPEVLKSLSGNSINLGIATGKDGKRARWLLSRMNLIKFFDLVIGSDEVFKPKPAPDIIKIHLDHFKTTPFKALMIGDSVADLKAGRRASVNIAAALWGGNNLKLLKEQPDYVLYSPEDILKIMEVEDHV